MSDDAALLELYDLQMRAYNIYVRVRRGDKLPGDPKLRKAQLAWREAHATLLSSGGDHQRVEGLLRARANAQPTKRRRRAT